MITTDQVRRGELIDLTTNEPKLSTKFENNIYSYSEEEKEAMGEELDIMLLCKEFKTYGAKTDKNIQVQEDNSEGADAEEKVV